MFVTISSIFLEKECTTVRRQTLKNVSIFQATMLDRVI
jgi:hypothetical protein